MERSILLDLLPPEIWHYYIYRMAHNMLYQQVIQDIKNRVVHLQIDERTRTFVVCNGINPFSVLAVF